MIYMNNYLIGSTPLLISLCLLWGCNNEDVSTSSVETEVVELDEYESVIRLEDNVLANPYMVRYDSETNHLFIYDYGSNSILEIDSAGEVIREFGGQGQGPGEVQGVNNFFLTSNHLYIIDHLQFFIHQYDREANYLSTVEYDEPVFQTSGAPPAPRPPFALDSNNQPAVLNNGYLLLPSHTEEGQNLFEVSTWDGTYIKHIGSLSDKAISQMDSNAYAALLDRGEVPPLDLHRAFIVEDRSNKDEYFLIYSSTPKLVKYHVSGQKLWERQIPETSEVERLIRDHYDLFLNFGPNIREPLRKYVSGVSDPSGDLYLALYTNLHTPVDNRSLWIHQFSPTGELKRRYRFKSDSDLLYFFDIDFDERLIFILPFDEAELRAYAF